MSNNKIGIRGVYWHKREQKWVARVKSKGVVVFEKYYDELSKATEAVIKARAMYLPYSKEARKLEA